MMDILVWGKENIKFVGNSKTNKSEEDAGSLR